MHCFKQSMEIQITYETIYELLRREKFRPELQNLDQSFFENIIDYLKEKQAITEEQKSKDSIFSQELERTNQELINVKKMIKELYEKREQKIIQLALSSTKTNNIPELTAMLKEEKEFFNMLKELLIKQRQDVLLNVLKTKLPMLRKEEPKDIKTEKQATTKLIRFVHSIPKFVAEDLNTYGPFIDEDIANIPIQVADVLIAKQKAEAVEI